MLFEERIRKDFANVVLKCIRIVHYDRMFFFLFMFRCICDICVSNICMETFGGASKKMSRKCAIKVEL